MSWQNVLPFPDDVMRLKRVSIMQFWFEKQTFCCRLSQRETCVVWVGKLRCCQFCVSATDWNLEWTNFCSWVKKRIKNLCAGIDRNTGSLLPEILRPQLVPNVFQTVLRVPPEREVSPRFKPATWIETRIPIGFLRRKPFFAMWLFELWSLLIAKKAETQILLACFYLNAFK